MKSLTLQDRRYRAAELITLALEEAVTVNYALAQWPALPPGELPDESLDVAYQALWHFGSDGPAREEDPFYLDVQIEVLRTVAALLSQGQPLPSDMLAAYRQHQGQAPRFYQSGRAGWLPTLKLKEWTTKWVQEYREALALLLEVMRSKKQPADWGDLAQDEPLTTLFAKNPRPLLDQPTQRLYQNPPRPAEPKKPAPLSPVVAVQPAEPSRSAARQPVLSNNHPVQASPVRQVALPVEIAPESPPQSPLYQEVFPSSFPRTRATKAVTVSPVALYQPPPAGFIPQPMASRDRAVPSYVMAGGHLAPKPAASPSVTRVNVQFAPLNERNAFVLSRRYPPTEQVANS